MRIFAGLVHIGPSQLLQFVEPCARRRGGEVEQAPSLGHRHEGGQLRERERTARARLVITRPSTPDLAPDRVLIEATFVNQPI